MGVTFRQTDFFMDPYCNLPCVTDFVAFLLGRDEVSQRRYLRLTADAVRNVTVTKFDGWMALFFLGQGNPTSELDQEFARRVHAIYDHARSQYPEDEEAQVDLLGKLRGAVLEQYTYMVVTSKSRRNDTHNRGCRVIYVDDRTGSEEPWLTDKKTVDVAWHRTSGRKIALYECKCGKGSLDHDPRVIPYFEFINRKLSELPTQWHTKLLAVLSFHDHGHFKDSLEEAPFVTPYGYQRLTEIASFM